MSLLNLLQEYSNVLIAIFACSTFILSLVIHNQTKQQQKEIQELLTSLTVATFLSGPFANETESATKLFFAHKESFMKHIK